jgi:hypothetical protein
MHFAMVIFYVCAYYSLIYLFMALRIIGVRWGHPSFVNGRRGVGIWWERKEGTLRTPTKGGSLPPHLQACSSQALWSLQWTAGPDMFLHNMSFGQLGFTGWISFHELASLTSTLARRALLREEQKKDFSWEWQFGHPWKRTALFIFKDEDLW